MYTSFYVIQVKKQKILVIVKAYPEKSTKYGSSICTAGLTEKLEWIRIYPIRLNIFQKNQKILRKRNWIEANIEKSNEKLNRKESYKVDERSIKLVDSALTKTNQKNIWNERNKILLPLLKKSREELEILKLSENLSIGLIKPKSYEFYIWKPINEINVIENKISQLTLEGSKIRIPDEIGNFFAYKFKCDDPNCKGHDTVCEDWEIREAFRSWRKKYKNPGLIKEKLIEKFQTFMESRDLYFIMGTTNPYNKWVIIGLYYPPKINPKKRKLNLDQFVKS